LNINLSPEAWRDSHQWAVPPPHIKRHVIRQAEISLCVSEHATLVAMGFSAWKAFSEQIELGFK